MEDIVTVNGERYVVELYEPEDGDDWWYASVKKFPGCHTQGKTRGQVMKYIREALSLYVDTSEF